MALSLVKDGQIEFFWFFFRTFKIRSVYWHSLEDESSFSKITFDLSYNDKVDNEFPAITKKNCPFWVPNDHFYPKMITDGPRDASYKRVCLQIKRHFW